jgi:hypothetical protein
MDDQLPFERMAGKASPTPKRAANGAFLKRLAETRQTGKRGGMTRRLNYPMHLVWVIRCQWCPRSLE